MTQKEWDECSRADVMLVEVGQFAGEVGSEERRRLVRCCCHLASFARPGATKDRLGIFDNCMKVVRAWVRGRGPTLEDVRDAAEDAALVAGASYAPAYAGAAAFAGNPRDCAVLCAIVTHFYGLLHEPYCSYRGPLAAAIVRRHYPNPPKKGDDSPW